MGAPGGLDQFNASIILDADGTTVQNVACTGEKTTTGVYTITLSQALDETEGCWDATVKGATAGMITITHTNDSVKVVKTFSDAGAAADRPFNFSCRKVAIG